MHTILIKIVKPFSGHVAGEQINVECDEHDTPLDVYWRRRLKDAQIDSCCEVVKPKAAPKRKTKTKSKED